MLKISRQQWERGTVEDGQSLCHSLSHYTIEWKEIEIADFHDSFLLLLSTILTNGSRSPFCMYLVYRNTAINCAVISKRWKYLRVQVMIIDANKCTRMHENWYKIDDRRYRKERARGVIQNQTTDDSKFRTYRFPNLPEPKTNQIESTVIQFDSIRIRTNSHTSNLNRKNFN